MVVSQQFLQRGIGLYIHLPWCLRKCPYCDFNSHATELDAFPENQYTDCLIKDLESCAESLSDRIVRSIFIGGGTPSLFSPTSIDRILTACKQHLAFSKECEITLETNPGTFEYQKFAEFFGCGINRLSIGVQSFDDAFLSNLGRIHDSQDALRAIETAQKIGFENINLDLMFGLPGQSEQNALSDLKLARQQDVSHISYYQLTLEPNTVFHRFPPQLPDNESCWGIQCQGIELLQNSGYQRYEVSAYARPDVQCTHNLNYWAFGDYLGVGAGSHSKLSTPAGITRNHRARQPDSYIKSVACGQHVLQNNQLSREELIFEFMLNNLRLINGFTRSSFTHATGLSWHEIDQLIDTLVTEDLLESENEQIRASALGYRFLDDILQRFLPERSTC